MQLDRLCMGVRLRNGWQAIDLGWVLARQWWRPLLLIWIVPYAVVLGLALLVLPHRLWWLAALFAWWLKPLCDAAALYLLSRRLFDEEISPPLAWREALGALGLEVLPWLLWRRFSPTRSLDMPLSVLERLRGSDRVRRLQLFHMRSSSSAMWLTSVCVNLELAIGMGLVGLLLWLLPDSMQPSLSDFYGGQSALLGLLEYGAGAIGAGLVAPFYVAAGFSIYLNRRVELEGWDIEIRFRHIASAVRRFQPVLLLAVLLLGVQCLQPPTAYASPPEPAMPSPFIPRVIVKLTPSAEVAAFSRQQKEARERIERIMNGRDFRHEQVDRSWRFVWKQRKAGSSKAPQWLVDIIETLGRWVDSGLHLHGSVVGTIDVLRWVLGAALVALFTLLLHRYREALRVWLRLTPTHPRETTQPQTLFGLDVRADSLPDDVLARVEALNQSRQFREALSLLYRASLTRLLHRFALPFRDDMTEGECAQLVAAGTGYDVSMLFAELTGIWQRQAYGHIAPTASAVSELCQRWQVVFDDAR